MPKPLRKALIALTLVVLLGSLAALIVWRLMQVEADAQSEEATGPVPVEVAAIERGRIEDRRTFSGTLVPRAEFIVAPKVSGRVETLRVEVGDAVKAGDVIAELDDDELVQAVAQAQAELAVAEATLAQARSALEIAEREFERVKTLRERGIASESAMDTAEADLRAKRAQVDVEAAQVQRAQAALGSEQVRLSYTKVVASWDGGGDERIVSERFVDGGATVAANDPIVTVVDLSTVRAVLFVTESDYARLAIGQPVTLVTDAYMDETFEGRVLRLAPVFEEASRQARVEIEVPNRDRKLKPGMFVRAAVVLGTAEDTPIVPSVAVVRREDQTGLFIIDDGRDAVRWAPVKVGIEAGERVQVIGDGLTGRAVTLGQQLLEDGSSVRVADTHGAAEATGG